ncbi:hypothetical protein [Rhodococcus sp. NPDC004095]
MENLSHKVFVTEQGQQIPVQLGDGIDVIFTVDGDEVVDTVPIEATPQEFEQIQIQALTNEIPADILREKKDE